MTYSQSSRQGREGGARERGENRRTNDTRHAHACRDQSCSRQGRQGTMHRIAWLSRAAPRDNGGLVGRLHAYPLSHSMPSAAADINDGDARNSSPSRYNHEHSQQHSNRGGTGGRVSAVSCQKRENQDDVMKAARTLAASLVQPSPAQKARRIWNGVVPVGGAGRWA